MIRFAYSRALQPSIYFLEVVRRSWLAVARSSNHFRFLAMILTTMSSCLPRSLISCFAFVNPSILRGRAGIVLPSKDREYTLVPYSSHCQSGLPLVVLLTR